MASLRNYDVLKRTQTCRDFDQCVVVVVGVVVVNVISCATARSHWLLISY